VTKQIQDIQVSNYFKTLGSMLDTTEATAIDNSKLGLTQAMNLMLQYAVEAHDSGCKVIVVGNGGSAGIASHMATDYTKNGNIRTMCFSDASLLTCLSNDLGYDQVFAKPIEMFAKPGDLLVAISSSGKSENILNAVDKANEIGCKAVTFSGFETGNPLRGKGDVNFYVPSQEYGYVELTHQIIGHAVLDFHCWNRDQK
jgi:D-sedoheptulose 7-phosphate isomerase